MSGWAARRFWKSVKVVEAEGGFAVELDSRPVRTPAKAPLVLPSRELAGDVASEWEAQEDTVDPNSMPVTRMANSAIDKVVPQRAAIIEMLAAYGGTDLLCYRATSPQELSERQAAAWDPLLDWAAERFGARLRPTSGVLPVAQDPDALARLSKGISGFTPFQLAAFHDLVTLPGSLVIGFAAAHELQSPESLWEISRIDEDWNIERWGPDEEAAANNVLKRQAFLGAARFFKLA